MLVSVVAVALSLPAVDLPPPREPLWETEAKAETNVRTGSASSDRVLRQRAIGLGVAGSILGTAWLSVSALAASSDLGYARAIDRGDGESCFDFCYSSPVLNPMMSPVVIAGAAFAGGALHAHGRWLARKRRGLGRSVPKARAILGAGLGLIVGTGVVLGGGLAMVHLANSARSEVWIRGLAWGGATATLTAGAALTGFGHGIRRGQRERRAPVAWSVAPAIGSSMGVAISGRF